ncbi:undecaprenyl-diphosphate phosphatase [uncultured Mobiluncus sp.]|uniref:undecaprenyl-diphosphate phosphatase n=1 Tax=uncultured Mobiluncus sp. TaxID=293425 RepID=UPI00288ADD58|nr:undecaprenyl-diphosphate phosphatase [uncultured Mobiluncus sp.]
MSWWEALILGIVEGITEYLPVSSTGHLTITEYLMGKQIDDVGMVAFTAVIQIGAIAAAVLYFWSDIWRIIKAWVTGLFHKSARHNPDYRFGWAIIIGSVPIAVVGLLFKDFIETGLRSMWFVAAGLVVWSAVLFAADHYAARLAAKTPTPGSPKATIADNETTVIQALLIGLMQCVSLIPGVSRSGATISAGLFLGFDRVLATRLSFFLGIPALVAAGTLEGVSNFDTIGETVGWAPTILGLAMSFIIGYASIAWLLKFVSKHSFNSFIIYRLCIGGLIAVLLIAGIIPAN